MSNENEAMKSSPIREFLVFAIAPLIVGILIIISWLLAVNNIGPPIIYIAIALFATIFGGLQRFISGFKDVFHRKITVNVFVTVALIATVLIGEFITAAILIFIMSVAGAFEAFTLNKTRKSIRSLLDLAPQQVTVKRNEAEIVVAIEEVQLGELVVVRPGERIAVDGIVVNGQSSVNQAPITGESIPVEKFKGSEVYSGTLNEEGRIEIKTTGVGEDTTLAKIIHLTESAQGTKPPIQTVADRFTQWFLPVVIVMAIAAYFVTRDVKTAVAVLLVACPCAFAIATPTAVTAGISNMARRGVLVKGGIFIEEAGKIDTLLVDKTGTFTLGTPTVMEIAGFNGFSEAEVIHLAAIGEKYSEHPLARAIIKHAKERRAEIPEPEEFKAEVGKGVIARFDGKSLLVGKEELLEDQGIMLDQKVKAQMQLQREQGRTIMLVAQAGAVIGLISIADKVRPGIRDVILLFKEIGIKNVTMLTGDNAVTAQRVAEEIGVDDFRANMLPEEKQQVVAEMQKQGKKVAMIGDGINDAPALALADIGMAMGATGTDVAIETADITLMNDDLLSVADFIWTSKKVFKRIKLNMFFSLVYNVIGLALASLAMLTPVWAIIFQEAGCLTVIISSTLLLWYKPKYPKIDERLSSNKQNVASIPNEN
ncbi:heavy metal translocating P-type ATPase [Acetobacterium wieringae]|uniref:heavy metal translocating P-type ATPase n=1 Tax=Acetobacterium wieringae TaxID=52694 RepID=UPI0020334A5B|nr:cation-translocating P-type ATPase [Acetobacterium wieringae]URN85997.1 cation-translocating P-type ATPase [Acetobacterium wieringae]